MIIKDMFAKDINRNIAPVIQVTLSEEKAIRQEVEEYVITEELKKHFNAFFDHYSNSFEEPTTDTGVWISGFFGSGKSHLLKMLSYIIENKDIDGTSTVEYFRKKLEDDPETFEMIENSTRNSTETILFNIDEVGPQNKDDTAILRIFARMFYDHLGYFGQNLKIVMLEKYIDSKGKRKEFQQAFKKHSGESWEEQRKWFSFHEESVVSTLMEVFGMSKESAENYFDDEKILDNFSFKDLVADIKEYVDGKGEEFHLVFMVDEVGQYVATNTSMLLNLQSFAEAIGRECAGQVWLVCTGQEDLDKLKEYGHVREDDLSRIQGRFRLMLSLSSSSVDEVIQKRILTKKDKAKDELKKVYIKNSAILDNLFTFTESIKSIRGYKGAEDFVINYPFVPYQFIVLQAVFKEIGVHGNTGANISRGERSMLSAFQAAAIRIQDRGNTALVPFYYFYDTVESILDSSIRNVIDHCRLAADRKEGIEPQDVDVLKLLYLILYLTSSGNRTVKEYIPANLDNIVILMADDINADKIKLREEIQKSLDRLHEEIYIGKNGENYYFLSNEQQDIEREIRKTQIDASKIVNEIGKIIFEEIYDSKKYHYNQSNSDFPYKQMVDEYDISGTSGDMCLKFLTVAMDDGQKQDFLLNLGSTDAVFVLLSDTHYYDSLRDVLKIYEYVKNNKVEQLPPTKQEIATRRKTRAMSDRENVRKALEKAIVEGRFYINGEQKEIKGNTAEAKINNAMEQLVESVYSELGCITKNIESEDEIKAILRGTVTSLHGMEPNLEAIKKVEDFLNDQYGNMDDTSMQMIQSKYQKKPYGWREIDIAAIVAQLIHDQKVTVQKSGNIIQPDDPKLIGMLRKKNEISEVKISKRILASDEQIREAKEFLREYFDIMDVHDDESGIVSDIKTKFGEQLVLYEGFIKRYEEHEYPDKALVNTAIELTKDVLSKEKDTVALIDQLLTLKNDLNEHKEKMRQIEGFFATQQVVIFDNAVKLEHGLQMEAELGYLDKDKDTGDALNEIRSICISSVEKSSFDYSKISKLNGLMDIVRAGHDKLLDEKREEITEHMNQCLEIIRAAAGSDSRMKDILGKADNFSEEEKEKIAGHKSLVSLNSLTDEIVDFKDAMLKEIDARKNPSKEDPPKKVRGKKEKRHTICKRSVVFPADVLESESDVDEYLKNVRKILIGYLEEGNVIDIK